MRTGTIKFLGAMAFGLAVAAVVTYVQASSGSMLREHTWDPSLSGKLMQTYQEQVSRSRLLVLQVAVGLVLQG
jgi:hypothetical protein